MIYPFLLSAFLGAQCYHRGAAVVHQKTDGLVLADDDSVYVVNVISNSVNPPG